MRRTIQRGQNGLKIVDVMFHGHTNKTPIIKVEVSMSEAPLHSLDVEVLPPPGDFSNDKNCSWCEGRSHRCGERTIVTSLVRDMGLNGQRAICMGRARDGERWLIATPGGRRVNMKMSNIEPAWMLKLYRERQRVRFR